MNRRWQNDGFYLAHVLAQVCRHGLYLVTKGERCDIRAVIERSVGVRTNGAVCRKPCDGGQRVSFERTAADGGHSTRDGDRSQRAVIECTLIDSLQPFVQIHIRQFGTSVESILVDGGQGRRQFDGLQLSTSLQETGRQGLLRHRQIDGFEL